MYNTDTVNGRAAKFASDTIMVLKTFAPAEEQQPIGITLTWPQLEQMIKANYRAAVETENVYANGKN